MATQASYLVLKVQLQNRELCSETVSSQSDTESALMRREPREAENYKRRVSKIPIVIHIEVLVFLLDLEINLH